MLGNGNNLEIVFIDEIEDCGALLRRIDVALDALEGIDHGSAALIDVAISLSDFVDSIFGEAFITEEISIDAGIGHGVVGNDGEWGNVAIDAAAALYHGESADFGTAINYGVGRENGMRADDNISGYLSAIADDGVTDECGVVPDMNLSHDDTTIAYESGFAGIYAAIDDDVLADSDVVANNAISGLTFPAEILRIGADDRPLINLDIIAEGGAGNNACVGIDFAIVANGDICIDVGKRVNDDVLAEFGIGANVGEF